AIIEKRFSFLTNLRARPINTLAARGAEEGHRRRGTLPSSAVPDSLLVAPRGLSE
ncbi:hypothetical protein chiPu_0030026, partial [Chiloscyllium punctatum]|nr:hypothetical protein [Chiloscyllium punctatum]